MQKIKVAIIGFVLLLVGISAYLYFHHKSPGITPDFSPLAFAEPSEKVETPPPLFLNFQLLNKKTGKVEPKSVMPITAKLEQPLKSEDIKIFPKIEGEWKWISNKTLMFQPKIPWYASQTFKFEFSPNVFATLYLFKKFKFYYTTPALKPEIKEFKLYQNPQDPSKLSLIATLQFNYPVNHEQLKNNISITPQTTNPTSLNVNIKFAKHDRLAYVQTDTLSLPENPQFYLLTIHQELHGGENISEKVLLPDAMTMMKIKNVGAQIMRDTQDKPQQVIYVSSTLGVPTESLQTFIEMYQLPVDYPANQIESAKKNYEWKRPGEVTPAILQSASKITLNAIPAAHEHANLHGFTFVDEGGKYLFIRIRHGLQGDGGYTLKNDYETVLPVPKLPQEVRFLHPGALMAISSEHRISVQVRGLPTVKYELGRVLPQEINHLITQTTGRFDDPYFTNYNFTKNDLSEIFTKLEDFNTNNPAKPQYSNINLDEFLKPSAQNPKPLGLFLIHAQGWDRTNNQFMDGSGTSRLVLMTDMALIVKQNADESRDVFVASITSGKPIQKCQVSVLSRNGLALMTKTVDDTGHVNLPPLPSDQYHDDKQPIVIIAKLNNDVSFIPYMQRDREINFSRFDTAGINDVNRDNLSAFVFTDRGIYRPGESVHLGFIIKKAYAQLAQPGLPIETVITDPQGNVVQDQKMNLTPTGYLTQDFTSSEQASTGNYNVAVYINKDNQRGDFLGDTNFQIQEFLPDTMKIKAEFSEKNITGWISPNELKASVKLTNLYGTPSSDRRVTGKIILNPRQFSFSSFKEYHFNDPLYNKDKPPKSISEELPDETTNAYGEASFNLNLTKFDKATYELSFYTQGFEKESGRSVSQQITALVSPLNYLVGYKTDTDYGFLKRNSQYQIHFIAINPQLKLMNQNELSISLIEQNNIASLVEKENGTFAYETLTQEKIIKKQTFNIPAVGADFPLPTDKIGHFVVAIQDKDGTELVRIPFNVVGENAQAIQKNNELTVSLDKKEYKSGDEIQLQISAPYTGSGLITIERNKVYAYQWFTANSTNSIQKIKIPAGFIGNGYINVTFMRDWNSPEIYLNPLSYNVTPFTVDKNEHALQITLSAPQEIHSGKTLSIHYKTNKSAKMIIFAVDEGVLQAAHYETPNPLDFFFQKRSLNVTTQQIIDEILPKYISSREISAVGGDMFGAKAAAVYLNPFKRKNLPTVAFWSGILDATTIEKSYEITLPQSYNGTLRIMAVAVSELEVGSVETSTLSQNDFIMMPTIPTFMVPGDMADIAVNITNNVKNTQNIPIKLTMTSNSGVEFVGTNTQTVTLNDQQETTVHFKLKAKNQLGNVDLGLTASNDPLQKMSSLTETMSIRPAVPFTSTLTSGYQATGEKTIAINQNFYPEKREQTIAVGNTPLIFVASLNQYLSFYPYGCTEQLTSQAIAALMLGSLNNQYDQFKKIMTKIQLRQNSDGSFTYWPNVIDDQNLLMEQRFSSVYVMHLLTEAREHKLDYTPMMAHGIEYLRQFAEANTKDMNMARLQAYAIYVLTRNEIVTTNYLTNLQIYLDQHYPNAWKNDILSSYIAATYALLHDDKNANQLIAGYYMHTPKMDDVTFFDRNSTDAQYLYLVAKHFPNMLGQFGKDSVIKLANELNAESVSTTSAAFQTLALSAYQNLTAKSSPMIVKTFTSQSQGSVSVTDLTPTSLTNDINKIMLGNPDNSAFFYQFSQRGFPNALPTSVVKSGVEISRDYTDAANQAIKQIKLGQEVYVHIKIRSLDQFAHPHMAIVDLLPGGFDIVENSATGRYLFSQAREDRMLFFVYLPVNDVREVIYRMKAAVPGDYTIPPAFTEDMYNARVKAMTMADKISIE